MNNRIIITGGTGSIGQTLVEKLLKRTEDTIIIFSRCEQKQEAMQEKFQSERLRFFLGDIRDKDRVEYAFRGVDKVIHAAALKIVPSLEYNPTEAIKTNILGTQNVIEAARRCGAFRVLALSTDKACSPTNLYGATKLCAEKLVIAANGLGTNYTHYAVVRYGNVSLSRGSVLPKFQELVKANKTLPVTDERMTRFWVTLNDASDFVLDCLGNMWEGGAIHIPKMRSYRIQDVATLMDRRPVVYTGIRPGEKIHETIISEDEYYLAEDLGRHYIIGKTTPRKNFAVKGAVTSANFVMNLDQLKEKLESVGIKCKTEPRIVLSKSLKISKKR